MSYNTKNYEKLGGAEWVVGGKLFITDEGLFMTRKSDGKVFQIVIDDNGVLQPVEV